MTRYIQATWPKEAFSSKKVRGHVLAELKHQAQNANAYLSSTVQYWQDPPKFKTTIRYKNASPMLEVSPDIAATPEGADHWYKANYGSETEYFSTSSDFIPKTEVPGSLGTNVQGRGYAWESFSPKIIRARGWSTLIEDLMEEDFAYSIQEAIRKGLEK